MNDEPEEWEEPEKKTSQTERPKAWEIDQDPEKSPVGSHKIGFWGGVGFGFLILILSAIISGACSSGIPMILGAVVAIGFLFMPTARMIFVGYVTLIATIFLVFVIFCGPILRGI